MLTQVMRPTATVTSEWTIAVPGGAHHSLINEGTSDDGRYIGAVTTGRIDQFTLGPAPSPIGEIISVILTLRGRSGTTPGVSNVRAHLVDGVYPSGLAVNMSRAFVTQVATSFDLTFTGAGPNGAWAWSDFDNIHLALERLVGVNPRITNAKLSVISAEHPIQVSSTVTKVWERDSKVNKQAGNPSEPAKSLESDSTMTKQTTPSSTVTKAIERDSVIGRDET